MEGVKFANLDRGRGGPNGFMDLLQVWCVWGDNGGKFHISSHFVGGSGEEHTDVSVKPCDMSCRKLVAIPQDVVEKALPQMK